MAAKRKATAKRVKRNSGARKKRKVAWRRRREEMQKNDHTVSERATARFGLISAGRLRPAMPGCRLRCAWVSGHGRSASSSRTKDSFSSAVRRRQRETQWRLRRLCAA